MIGSRPISNDLAFDHIGIVVRDLDTGAERLAAMLGQLSWTRRFDDSVLGVSVRFGRDMTGIVYEVIAPLGDKSPVASALSSRTNLLNQIAYRTKSLTSTVARLRTEGAVPVSRPLPAAAFGGALVQFLMSDLGFLIEVIEIDFMAHQFE